MPTFSMEQFAQILLHALETLHGGGPPKDTGATPPAAPAITPGGGKGQNAGGVLTPDQAAAFNMLMLVQDHHGDTVGRGQVIPVDNKFAGAHVYADAWMPISPGEEAVGDHPAPPEAYYPGSNVFRPPAGGDPLNSGGKSKYAPPPPVPEEQPLDSPENLRNRQESGESGSGGKMRAK